MLLEGQEEVGSPHLADLLKRQKKLLKSDLVVSADGGQIGPDQGGICLGLRGAVAFEVGVQTLHSDLHSGELFCSALDCRLEHGVAMARVSTCAAGLPGLIAASTLWECRTSDCCLLLTVFMRLSLLAWLAQAVSLTLSAHICCRMETPWLGTGIGRLAQSDLSAVAIQAALGGLS